MCDYLGHRFHIFSVIKHLKVKILSDGENVEETSGRAKEEELQKCNRFHVYTKYTNIIKLQYGQSGWQKDMYVIS